MTIKDVKTSFLDKYELTSSVDCSSGGRYRKRTKHDFWEDVKEVVQQELAQIYGREVLLNSPAMITRQAIMRKAPSPPSTRKTTTKPQLSPTTSSSSFASYISPLNVSPRKHASSQIDPIPFSFDDTSSELANLTITSTTTTTTEVKTEVILTEDEVNMAAIKVVLAQPMVAFPGQLKHVGSAEKKSGEPEASYIQEFSLN